MTEGVKHPYAVEANEERLARFLEGGRDEIKKQAKERLAQWVEEASR